MYIMFLGIPLLMVWVFGWPLFAFLSLYYMKKDFEEGNSKQYFLVLYQGYKTHIYYWEFINIARKMTVQIWFLLNNTLKIVISSFILIISVRIQNKIKPYKKEAFNGLEMRAINICIITILSNLIFTEEMELIEIRALTLIIVILLNLNFLLNWLYYLLKSMKSEIKFITRATYILGILLRMKRNKESQEEWALNVNSPNIDQSDKEIKEIWIFNEDGRKEPKQVLKKFSRKKGKKLRKRKLGTRKKLRRNKYERSMTGEIMLTNNVEKKFKYESGGSISIIDKGDSTSRLYLADKGLKLSIDL